MTLTPNKYKKGFTLNELLLVIAIMAILAGLIAPAIAGGNRMGDGLGTFGDALELAKEYATGKNTYVWVLVLPTTTGGYPNSAKVALIASKDGTDSLLFTSTPVVLEASTNLELVEKVHVLPSVQILDAPTVTGANFPATDSSDTVMATMDISVGSGGQQTVFTRVIEFTPTGEARTSLSLARYIDLAMSPQLKVGANASPNQAVLRIAEMTGKTTVYRN